MVPLRWQLPLKLVRPIARLLRVSTDESVRKFVLVTEGRTGSTWVIHLLESHPEIVCFGELFHENFYGTLPDGSQDIVTWNSYTASLPRAHGRIERFRMYFKYFDQYIYRQRPGRKAIGFKLSYTQAVRGFAILAYLKAHRVSVIHLLRRNHLDRILSEDAIHARAQLHARVGVTVAPVQIHLEPESLLRRIEDRDQQNRSAREFYSKLGVPCFELFYEDLLKDQSAMVGVLRFLGVDPTQPLHSPLQKLNPTDHRQIIANFDEVRDVLEGTPFAHLLRTE